MKKPGGEVECKRILKLVVTKKSYQVSAYGEPISRNYAYS